MPDSPSLSGGGSTRGARSSSAPDIASGGGSGGSGIRTSGGGGSDRLSPGRGSGSGSGSSKKSQKKQMQLQLKQKLQQPSLGISAAGGGVGPSSSAPNNFDRASAGHGSAAAAAVAAPTSAAPASLPPSSSAAPPAPASGPGGGGSGTANATRGGGFGTPPPQHGNHKTVMAASSSSPPLLAGQSPGGSGSGGGGGGGGGGGVTSTTFGSVANRNQTLARSSSSYDSDDDDFASGSARASGAAAGTGVASRGGGGGGGGGGVRQFDLCSTLYKRRGGFGRNKQINWVKRCCTLHGPVLCYYDTPTISESDPSRPRGRLNLQREDTRAEMNTKFGTSSPTEFQVTLNLYVLGSKRKWELCCPDGAVQERWYEALRAYDGKAEDEDGGGGGGGGGPINSLGRSRGAVGSATAGGPSTPGGRPGSLGGGGGGGGAARGRKQNMPRESPVIRAASPTDDEVSVDVAAGDEDYGTFLPPAAAAAAESNSSDAVARRRRRPPLPRRSAAPRGAVRSFLDHHVIVSFVALNVALYFARHGNEETFYLALFLANLVFYYLLDHLSKREEVRALRREAAAAGTNRAARSATTKVARHRVRSGGSGSADVPTVLEEEEGDKSGRRQQQPQPSLHFDHRLAAGSTLPRATPIPNTSLSDVVQKHGPVSAEALRAYASALSDYENDAHHAYWNVAASTFKVRVGPNYKKNGKKAPSAPALYDLYGMDVIQDDMIMKNVSDGFELPDVKGVTDIDTGCPDVPPMFVITVNMPTEEPSMFGGETDGHSCIVVLYFLITEQTLEELKDLDTASPGVKLFVEFCRKGGTDEAFRSRFKALAVVEDIEKLGLPSFITGFNGKPALITKSGAYARHSNYIEMTVNVHRWGYLPRKGLYMLKNEFCRFVANIGFTVEGRKDHELPEVLLGGVRLMCLDFAKVQFAPDSSGGGGGADVGGEDMALDESENSW